jgi:hypothetical protein
MIEQVEEKLKQNSLVAAEKDVVVGLSTSTSGYFFIIFSMSKERRRFGSLKEVFKYILEN